MSLISSIEQLKAVCSFVSKSLSMEGLQSDLDLKEQKVLKRWLGADLLAELKAYVPGSSAENDTKYADLLKAARRTLGNYALYAYASKNNVQFNSAGLQSAKSQTQVPVREWMLTDIKKQILLDACESLDLMIALAVEKIEAYKDSPQLKAYQNDFVPSLELFELHFGLNGSYYTWIEMNRIMRQIEFTVLTHALGSEMLEELKGKLAAIDGEANAKYKTLLTQYVRPVLVFATVWRALDVLTLKITAEGAYTSEYMSTFEQHHVERKGSLDERERLKLKLGDDVQKYIERMTAYLNKEATSEVFAAWFGSEMYVAPETETTDTTPLGGFFGMV
jgi:hypothetical protein